MSTFVLCQRYLNLKKNLKKIQLELEVKDVFFFLNYQDNLSGQKMLNLIKESEAETQTPFSKVESGNLLVDSGFQILKEATAIKIII